MGKLTEEQEMLTDHRWFHQLAEWLLDNHKSLYEELKREDDLELWIVKKLETAIEMRDGIVADGIHPSQADELAKEDMFSL
ncbi:hypothetical protein [Ferruginibacter sp. SUN106]|uniref:hypothetical protein n=1 Tax=Ferruginibacter sp. SUN106 TaxID=2978348 RepID=UPI003D36ABCD